MNPTDAAILSVIGHGGIQELVDGGLSWEWVENPDAQIIVREAMSLYQRNRPVNFTNVTLRIALKDYTEAAKAWQDGYGSTALEAVLKCKSEYLRRQVGKWLQTSNELWNKSPQEVRKWWPQQVLSANTLLKTGEVYSPLPSSHASKAIPEMVYPLPSQGLNGILRGGIWKPALIGFSSPSGAGKTTSAVSLAVNCSRIGAKNVIFTSEMPEQYYVYRVMRGFGFSKDEFRLYTRSPDETERGALFKDYLHTLDSTLSIYGAEFMDARKIEYVLSVERPDVFQIDHLLAVRLTGSKRQNDSMALGDLIYAVQDFTNRFMCMGVAYGQLSGKDAEDFQRNHDLPFTKFFGSAIVNQAMRLAGLTSRHWVEPEPGGWSKQYTRVKKNSLEENGEVDTVHLMRFDPNLAIYVD